MEKSNGKMTLDKLARMVADGFESIEQRMATKEDITSIEQRMATKEDISRLEQKIIRLDFRIEEIHDIVTTTQEGDIVNLQKRVTVLKRTVKAGSK